MELTSLNQYDSDEDAALTAELDMTLPSDHPPFRKTQCRACSRKSLCSCLSLIVVVVAVFVVALVHNRHDASTMQQSESTMNHHHHDDQDKYTYDDKTIAEWLQANVTLKDGIKYQVLGQIEHDPTAFTEGLTYANGFLYESTGLKGGSSIRTLDPTTGKIIHSYPMDKKYFGEGLTYVNGKLYQLTYKMKTGFIFDAYDLSKKPETFSFQTTTGEGWGMTYDSNKNELIVSDGSPFLHYWNATTTKPLRKVHVVRQNNQDANNINELEWWRGRVLANVWFEDTILVIHPETGIVEKEYDFKALWPKRTRKVDGAGVLNGISVSEDPDVLYITGKNWNRTYLVK